MLIAFCIFKYFPYGGMQRDFLRIARECRTRGHRVRIYAIRWQGDVPDDMELVLAPVRGPTNHRRYERFATWVRSHLVAAPVDLVVGMNKMPGLDAYYAADSCFEDKARTQRPRPYRWLRRYRLFARFERAVWSRYSTTEILTISDVQTPLYKRYYGTPDHRLHPLPPGVERDRVASANMDAVRQAVRAELGIDDDTPLVLFVGSGFIKKGLDRAIAAFAELPASLATAQLLVVGADNADRFVTQAEQAGLKERVHFLGGRDDIPRLLFAADGLVLPAHDENTGGVILEAMVAGLPALVTENCGYAHYVRNAKAGIVTPMPYDQSTFVRQLVELLTSPERSRWRANGLAFAAHADIYDLVPRAVDVLEEIGRRRVASRQRTVAFCLFKYFPYGGLQRDFFRVAAKCRELGVRVRVYTLSWQGELLDGIEVREVPVGGVTNHRRYQRFIDWVNADLERDPARGVVGFNKMPGLDLYFAADSCYEEKAQKFRSRLYRSTARYRFFSEAERAVFEAASHTHVLLLSERQRIAFQRYYGTPDDRFTVLPPGIESDRMAGDDAEDVRQHFREQHGLAPDDRLMLLIGSGFVTKGLDRAIEALAALPDDLKRRTRLIAIGQDHPAPFQRLAERLGVAHALQILPGRDDIPRFLLGADVLVHPALMEAGGIVLIEAIVAGLPAIATDVCGYASYIERAEAGLVVPSPFDKRLFVEMLTHVLRDDAARARWKRNGVAFGRTEDLYSLPDRTAAIVEALARRGSDARPDGTVGPRTSDVRALPA
jgi:UDP-glucose:(heptosyl)LPS alpha-1,3-glucosyltransferase